MLSTFAFVTFAWIFFRADDIPMAWGYIQQIGISLVQHPSQLLKLTEGKIAFVYILPLIVGDWYVRRDERQLKELMPSQGIIKTLANWLLYIVLIILVLVFFSQEQSFIYFQF